MDTSRKDGDVICQRTVFWRFSIVGKQKGVLKREREMNGVFKK